MRRFVVGLVAAVITLAACGGPETPSLPERPSNPASWGSVSSTSGDLTVALPPDLRPQETENGIRAQWSQVSGTALIEVWVTAPAAVDQPDDIDGDLRPWLEQLGWVPRPGFGGVAAIADDTQRDVLLPSGTATEVVVTTDPGQQTELRVVTYGIRTSEGMAVIMIRGAVGVMEQRSEDLRLIAVLAEFSPPDPEGASANAVPSPTP